MVMAALVVATAVATAPAAAGAAGLHVRSDDPHIRTVLEYGLTQSLTVRRLVAVLDHSDVIVYVEPRHAHEALGGYLSHHIVTVGGMRYLRVRGGPRGARYRRS